MLYKSHIPDVKIVNPNGVLFPNRSHISHIPTVCKCLTAEICLYLEPNASSGVMLCSFIYSPHITHHLPHVLSLHFDYSHMYVWTKLYVLHVFFTLPSKAKWSGNPTTTMESIKWRIFNDEICRKYILMLGFPHVAVFSVYVFVGWICILNIVSSL